MSNYMIDSKRRDIRRLKEQNAKHQADIAKKRKDIIRCNDAIKRTRSTSTINMKLREIERHENQIASLENKIADNQKRESQLSTHLDDLITKQEKERSAVYDKALKDLEIQMKQARNVMLNDSEKSISTKIDDYDVFISHASEDKKEIADELAQLLRNKGVKVWYDKFVLAWGDSLSRKIGEGISNSKFGIVILSHNFFSKEWPQQELDALFNKELLGGKVILPIWHNISKSEVSKYSPLIAGKLALKTSDLTIEEICEELEKMLV